MSSFCFHCDFCNKKSQKPLWVLGFRRRHLFRSAILAGVQGFEPRKCQSQSLRPYRLATPQYFQQTILYHIKLSLSIPILNFFEKFIHYFLFFRKIAFFYFTNALFCDTIQRSDQNLPVAQLDSASDSDSEGRRFKSCRVGQNKKREDNFLPYFTFG